MSAQTTNKTVDQLWDEPYRPNGGLTVDGEHEVKFGAPEMKQGNGILEIPFEVISGACFEETAKWAIFYEKQSGINQVKQLLHALDPDLVGVKKPANVLEGVSLLANGLKDCVVTIKQKTNGEYVNFYFREFKDNLPFQKFYGAFQGYEVNPAIMQATAQAGQATDNTPF
jgi:hypothetical protein